MPDSTPATAATGDPWSVCEKCGVRWRIDHKCMTEPTTAASYGAGINRPKDAKTPTTAALRDWPCTNADHLGLCSDRHVHVDHRGAGPCDHGFTHPHRVGLLRRRWCFPLPRY